MTLNYFGTGKEICFPLHEFFIFSSLRNKLNSHSLLETSQGATEIYFKLRQKFSHLISLEL